MNPWVLLGAILAVILAAGAGYGKGHKDASLAIAAQQKHDDDLVRKATESMEQSVAKNIAGIEVRNVTIRQELQREVVEKPVYRDCVNTPDGLSLINSAIRGVAAPVGPGRGVVPGPDPTH